MTARKKSVLLPPSKEVKEAINKAIDESTKQDADLLKKVYRAKGESSPALEAVTLVYGQRNLDYGDPFQNFAEIAAIANAIKDRNDTNVYTTYGIATVLTALKLARIKHNPSPDSFVDLCGYTDIKGRMAKAGIHTPKTGDGN